MPPASSPVGPRSWRTSALLVVTLSLIIGLSGSVSLPLEGHESFVLQATREMHARQDWIIPYFNGEPRLTKPPLNYWLTGLVAWLSHGLKEVQPWHARAVSILSGVGLTVLALVIGVRLYDRRVAIIGALIVATSAGYFTYVHDGRPDMLYAFWCTAAYATFLHALTLPAPNWMRLWYALLIWCCIALATLTKGPHAPVMILVACIVICRYRGLAWGDVARILQPVAGIILLAALSIPWWWLVQQRLGGQGLHGTQLGGSLLTINPKKFLNLYYFYRPLQLVLPWWVLIPAAIALPFRKEEAAQSHRSLGILIVVLALFFSFGPQQRWHYLLPVLVPMGLLMAAATVRGMDRGWLTRATSSIVAIHAAAIVAALLWTAREPEALSSAHRAAIFVAAISCAVLALLYYRLHRQDAVTFVATLAVMFALVYCNPGLAKFLWSQDRHDHARLATTVASAAGISTPIAMVGANPDIYTYYAARPISMLASPTEVTRLLAESASRELILIIPTADVALIPAVITKEVLDYMPGDRDEATSILRLQLPST